MEEKPGHCPDCGELWAGCDLHRLAPRLLAALRAIVDAWEHAAEEISHMELAKALLAELEGEHGA